MKNLQKLIDVCQAYKAGNFGVEEFQHKIEAIYLPDECKHTLEKLQHNAFNYLEKIFYFYPQDEHKQYAEKVADDLIQATLAEQERLKDQCPYQQ
ncbi:MAG: hypothetical protein BGN88_07700 [Clostridiales bacterium 43-6]|nr:MAG: hypothetical protein BGN88_07700 [Clostridiales bacterium 43-6]